MRKPIFRRALFVLCVAALAFAACDGMGLKDTGDKFDLDLRGRWMTLTGNRYEENGYDGTLEIDSTSIEIFGFLGVYTPEVNTLDTRPFKDFPKQIVMKGYSESDDKIDDIYKGKIFIRNKGVWSEGIEFTYSEESEPETLIFNFGDGDIWFQKHYSQ